MHDVIRLRGGRPLIGEISVSGAKNAVPKNMVAAMLTDQPCVIHNVPDIEDVEIIGKLIDRLGGSVKKLASGSIRIVARGLRPLSQKDLDDISGRSRIPILLAGPLLHRFGLAVVPKLGGCNIGPRPIDFHVKALQALGATYQEDKNGARFSTKGLKGSRIDLDYPSVGATEQSLLSSVLAAGVTEIYNAAVEPEILDLIALLQKMGAIISVNTDRVITIEGVIALKGFEHQAMPDRIETASWASAAVATNGRIFIRGARQLDMMTFLNKLRQTGGEFTITDEGISFFRATEKLQPITLETDVHPGFMTDWQQPFTVLLTQAHGQSIIHETVYQSRFGYTETLNQMGAKITVFQESPTKLKSKFGKRNYAQSIKIDGPTHLHGADITVPDLRAGFSYIVAALVAEGESTIRNASVLYRGYERLEEKLADLGVELLPITN